MSASQNPPPQQGSETRNSILTSESPSGIGMFGSSYSPADAMKTPADLNIHVGNSMDDVINAVKGVGFYTDQIGFGASSTGLTKGMPLEPLGVNYFIKTGMKCSNGADMWHYMKGITEGNALGPKVQKVMAEMGLPPLQGLAPGMIEDAENALNPQPLMDALFGSGYPQCKQTTMHVGDAYGRIKDPDTGEVWISMPKTAVKRDDKYYQTAWVQDTDTKGNPITLTKDKWMAEKKTFKADGTPIKAQGFRDFMVHPGTIITIGVLCAIALGVIRSKRVR
jgi:hypothetical protein